MPSNIKFELKVPELDIGIILNILRLILILDESLSCRAMGI
ncbi:Uncharacterised protein [Candidatus Tiddalikarchaeum anstoanum]|nr:Uncharacterised protein [Candidatus Tiddalikarchaeum anstoanum]